MTKIVLSFDDGREDNYRAAKEILEPLAIPATFNITTGYIYGDIRNEDKPGFHNPMTIKQVQKLSQNHLFEIAGHGYTHDNNVDNLLYGVKELRKIVDKASVQGIASPHSQFDLTKLEAVEPLYTQNGIEYLRVSNNYERMSEIKKWIRRINRMIHIPALYYWVNSDSIMEKPGFLLYSIPVIRDNSLKEVRHFINLAKANRNIGICIFMFHSILQKGEPFYKDLFTWDYNKFHRLCSFLVEERDKGTINLCTTRDLFPKEMNHIENENDA